MKKRKNENEKWEKKDKWKNKKIEKWKNEKWKNEKKKVFTEQMKKRQYFFLNINNKNQI